MGTRFSVCNVVCISKLAFPPNFVRVWIPVLNAPPRAALGVGGVFDMLLSRGRVTDTLTQE